MNLRFLILTLALFSFFQSVGQRGKIIKTATSNVLDPNGDGFVSKTTAGFSNDGYYVDEFELTMFGIPKLTGDVLGDNVGKSCGITDLIPDSKGFSVYAVRDDNNNLIFRFRVGDDNPSVESWSILLDTDGLFGSVDSNSTSENPGFEVNITLIKNPQSGVWVYNIDGVDNCPTPLLSYPLSSHFQISIADEVSCGDPDYFYDFFVPFNQLATALQISESTGLRFAAVSNVSATCAMGGKISDISGVDNDDYANCPSCAFEDLVGNQCATSIVDLCLTCLGFEKDKVNAPTIDLPVRAGQLVISGTSDPDIFIKVEIYSRVGGTDALPLWSATPRETRGVYAVATLWSATLSNPLQSYDKIVAKAQKNETSIPCGTAGGNQASASVTVVQPNTPPVALNQTINVTEDIPKSIGLTATDPEGDVLTFSIINGPVHGSLSGTAPNLLYTPAANYAGPDNFTFQVSDGIFNSIVAGTISIAVAPVNDVPIANSQSVVTLEDAAKAITLTALDADGNALTYSIASGPSHGVLSGSGSSLVYTPLPNYHGADVFTFNVNDGFVDSDPATVSITVTSVDDLPQANNQSTTTLEDVAKSITLTGSDPDGESITYLLVSGPTHGSLTGTGATITYSPFPNYSGPDAFTFKVNDGVTDSNIATVSITVSPVIDVPLAGNQSVSTNEDVAKSITLVGSDADGDILTYTIASGPLHGTLSGSGANITYTPSPDYNGPDGFTFKVNDGTTDSSPAAVSITIIPLGDPPVATNQSVTTNEDVAKAIVLIGNDPDGDPITYSIVSSPVNGTLTGVGANVTYVPGPNFNGSDNFTFLVNDGSNNSNTATVSITINALNDAPVAVSESINYDLNVAKIFTLSGSDVDGNPLTFTVLTLPLHGALTGTPPNLTYTPDIGSSLDDSFTFKVNDGTVDSNIGTISLFKTVGVNVAPVANDLSISVMEDENSAIGLTATDANADPLTYSIITGPGHGTLSGAGANKIYTPDGNYFGPDSFIFSVNDGSLNSNLATVLITVTGVSDTPLANEQSITTTEDVAVSITLVASDPDADALSYTIASGPTQGGLSGTAPNLTYTPGPNYFGSDNFTFKVNDGSTDSNLATVSITITPSPDPPEANSQIVATQEDVAKSVTLVGSDPDGDAITYSIVSSPTHGSVSLTGTTATYTPELNYNGVDAFTFKVNDGTNDSNIATVSLNISGEGDIPVVQSFGTSTPEDVPQPITLLGSDPDGDILTYTIVNPPGNGTLTGTAPNVIYTPAANFFGADNFSYIANDGSTDSNIGIVSISVSSVGDSPLANDQNVSAIEDVPKTIELTGTDPDGDAISFALGSLPVHGTASLSGTTVLYTPELNFYGADSFTFKVNDGSTDSNLATVTIAVANTNDGPIAYSQSLTIAEDEASGVTLTGTDIDGDALTFTIDTNPVNGDLTGTAPSLNYRPAMNFNGLDSFSFTVTDGSLTSSVGFVSITITPQNDAPTIAVPPVLFTKEDSTYQVCLSVVDVEGDPIIFLEPINLTGGGTMVRDVVPFDFCYIFAPVPNFNGESIWDVRVSDSHGLVGTGEVKIVVLPVNDAPLVVRKIYETKQDSTITVCPDVTDLEGDPSSLASATAVLGAAVNGDGTDLCFEYSPKPGYYGMDSVSVKVCDKNDPLVCVTETLLVDILPKVNLPPEFFDEGLPIDTIYLSTQEDVPISFCFEVKDPNRDPVSLGFIERESGLGEMTMIGDTQFCFSYTPSLNFFGASQWKIAFCDNKAPALCGELTVILDVTAVNDPPVAVKDTLTTLRYAEGAVQVLANDIDVDGDVFAVTRLVEEPKRGSFSITTNGLLTYQSERYFRGEELAMYEVCDNGSVPLCATASVLIQVGDLPLKPYEGFSPNGDGLNDFWRIDGIDYYRNNKVKIFDRYNNLVFELDGYNNEDKIWRGEPNHGLFEAKLLEGTYFYSILIEPGSKPVSGFIVLKRE